MKKSILVCILMIICMQFGCGKTVEFDEAKLESVATEYALEMADNEITPMVDNFNAKMAKSLTKEQLEEARASVVKDLGEYIGLESVEGNAKGSYFSVTIVQRYENNGLKTIISFDEKEEVAGIYFTNEALAEQTDIYEEMEVTIGDVYPLEGLLTIPKNVDNPPVVLLVQGSGPSDKNETIYSNTPFADIAHGLADMGIASLRFDKRFYTYPEAATSLGGDVTLGEEVLADVFYALDYLKTLDSVNKDEVYVLGHSLGGGLTPYIATNTEVAGIISMAGSLRPLYEISYDQNKAMEQNVEEYELSADDRKIFEQQMAQVEQDILALRSDISELDNETILLGLPAGYQKSVQAYAGENFINQVQVPILVLQGDADFQVSVEKDYNSWLIALEGKENTRTILYEGLNHLMMESNGAMDITEYEIKGEVSEKVIFDIGNFILKK